MPCSSRRRRRRSSGWAAASARADRRGTRGPSRNALALERASRGLRAPCRRRSHRGAIDVSCAAQYRKKGPARYTFGTVGSEIAPAVRSRSRQRWLVIALALSVVCAPVVSRAFQRIDPHRSPTQEHSRFRWSNSCESVPKKATVSQSADETEPAVATVVFEDRAPREHAATHIARAVAPLLSVQLGLRAPPLSAL